MRHWFSAVRSEGETSAATTAAGELVGSPLPIGPAGVTSAGGLRLPPVGFGTYKLTGEHGMQVITDALQSGYRLLDSAFS